MMSKVKTTSKIMPKYDLDKAVAKIAGASVKLDAEIASEVMVALRKMYEHAEELRERTPALSNQTKQTQDDDEEE